MVQMVIDEREHRRGLVLGLTLAEVLLLLLFLLLLTLAAKLNELNSQKDSALQQLNHANIALEKLRPLETGSIDVKDFAKKVASLGELEARNAALERANIKLSGLIEALKGNDGQLSALTTTLRTAAKFDPSNPPAVLNRALSILEKLGPDLSEDMLSELVKAKADIQAKADAQAKSTTSSASTKPAGIHNWPPIISLSEADGYFFQTGSADLSPDFRFKLGSVLSARLLEIIKQYEVNVIEVIGHTDEQRITERPSNLDKTLIPYLNQKGGTERFVPADNAGLGLARAVSVVQILSSDPRLAGLRVLPLSGAQLIDVDDKLADGASGGDVKERRRIEIRVRRSEKARVADARPWAPQIETEQPLVGRALVVDGDTIEINGTRIRIWGVDAIESDQTCTLQGRTWDCAVEISRSLKSYLEGQTVTCTSKGRDTFERMLATCSVRNRDLGAWLVRQGHALDYARFSLGAYKSEQTAATADKRGIWQGEFTPPWVWRQTRK